MEDKDDVWAVVYPISIQPLVVVVVVVVVILLLLLKDKDDMWAEVYPISIQPPALCPRALALPLLKLSPRSNYDNGDDDDTLIDGRDINSS